MTAAQSIAGDVLMVIVEFAIVDSVRPSSDILRFSWVCASWRALLSMPSLWTSIGDLEPAEINALTVQINSSGLLRVTSSRNDEQFRKFASSHSERCSRLQVISSRLSEYSSCIQRASQLEVLEARAHGGWPPRVHLNISDGTSLRRLFLIYTSIPWDSSRLGHLTSLRIIHGGLTRLKISELVSILINSPDLEELHLDGDGLVVEPDTATNASPIALHRLSSLSLRTYDRRVHQVVSLIEVSSRLRHFQGYLIASPELPRSVLKQVYRLLRQTSEIIIDYGPGASGTIIVTTAQPVNSSPLSKPDGLNIHIIRTGQETDPFWNLWLSWFSLDSAICNSSVILNHHSRIHRHWSLQADNVHSMTPVVKTLASPNKAETTWLLEFLSVPVYDGHHEPVSWPLPIMIHLVLPKWGDHTFEMVDEVRRFMNGRYGGELLAPPKELISLTLPEAVIGAISGETWVDGVQLIIEETSRTPSHYWTTKMLDFQGEELHYRGFQ